MGAHDYECAVRAPRTSGPTQVEGSRATWENGRIRTAGTGPVPGREGVNHRKGVRYFTEGWYARYRTGRW